MERSRRRWWTFGLSTVAALVVLAATLSLTFRLVVDAVPGYRERLQGLVTQAAGHPSRIGSMALTWQDLQPSLDLRDVALLDAQGQPLLRVSRLRLGFKLRRLLRADWVPGTIELYGLQLEADVDELGHWSLRGFDSSGGGKLDPAQLQRLASLERVRLRDCRLLLHDPQFSRQPLNIAMTDADLRHDGQRYTLAARLQPPPELASRASASATLQGDLSRPETWQGGWNVQLDEVQGWPWLAGALTQGVQLSVQRAQLRLSGRIESGRLAEVDAQAAVDSIAAARGKEPLARVEQLQLDLAAWPETDAWRAEIRKLALRDARGQLNADGHFHYARTAQGSALDAAAEGLRLDDLAPWLALWKDLPAGAARLRDARGDVHDLALHYEQPSASGTAAVPARYSVHARLAGAGLAAQPTQSGFSGLDAVIDADQDGGHLQLRQAAFQVQLPEVFAQPLPVTALSGDFAWKHEPGSAAIPGSAGWRVAAPQFDWKLIGTNGRGQLSLLLPDQADSSPNLQILADFAAEDVPALKPWMPRDWGAGTRDWLNRALLHGRVARGHLQLDGPMADYPFVEKPDGHWILDLDVADGTLAYAPGWPQAEKMQAQLHFRGHGLQITSSGAQIAGNSVDHIESQIPDFRQARLTVDGGTHGDAAHYYALLRNSPLQKKLSGLLAETDAAGPAAVDVHLEIPLNVDNPPVLASGTARFDGGTVKVRGIDQPVSGLSGKLSFDDQGVRSEGLGGQLYGSTLKAVIRAEPDSPDGVLLVQTDAPVQSADGLFGVYTPDWLRQRLSGTAHLAARLPFAGPRSGQLSLSSDLRGVAVRLPQPAAKGVDDSLPLTVTVGEGAAGNADTLRVAIDGGERLGVALRFARAAGAADAPLLTRSVELRLGPGAMPRADGEGIYVSGTPALLDVESWTDLLDDIAAAGEPGGPSAERPAAASESSRLAFRGADLTPQRLVYRGAALQQAHLRVAPTPGGWSAQLDGPAAQGRIEYARANGGRVQARLQRLQLQALGDMAQSGSGDPPGPPFDPNQAPLLDLACDSLHLGNADLGRFSLLTSRAAGGQNLDQLKLEGGQLQANTRGTWLRRNGSSYADLSFQFNARDLGTVLQAFGYAQTMDARKAQFSGTLTWPQAPDGLELAQARGSMALSVEKGTLRQVEPGAGRVLGLLNLYALPRRLTFDFKDVVSKGLGFDSLVGSFRLADGQAQTDDLQLVSPSMKMEISGRIGLAARDYDQKITVHPDLSTEVIVGATLVNPIAGGVALLAQQVFNKPFSKLSQFSYRVTGSWDNPQVKGADNKGLDKSAPAAEPQAAQPPPLQDVN